MIDLHLGDYICHIKTIPDQSVDLVLTDPPYGITACKWDTPFDLDAFWVEVKRVAKHNAAFVITSAQPFTSRLGTSNISQLRYSWVWQKNIATGHLSAKIRPLKNHEDILVFFESQPTYIPQGLVKYGKKMTRRHNGGCYGLSGKSNLQSHTGYPRTVLKIDRDNGKHPTQKPVALMEYLIKTYSKEGKTVLDPFMGSGTTGVACVNLDRSFIGMEKEQKYFDIATERIKEAQDLRAGRLF